jgi:hypothetical protein
VTDAGGGRGRPRPGVTAKAEEGNVRPPPAQAAIDRLFGSPTSAPARLTAQQLDRYYSRGAHAGEGRSTAALANAVLVKYLVEAVLPWFS